MLRRSKNKHPAKTQKILNEIKHKIFVVLIEVLDNLSLYIKTLTLRETSIPKRGRPKVLAIPMREMRKAALDESIWLFWAKAVRNEKGAKKPAKRIYFILVSNPVTISLISKSLPAETGFGFIITM